MTNEQLLEEQTWLGRATCSILPNSTRYGKNTGATLNFACRAKDVAEAAALIQRECLENDLVIRGFGHLECRAYLDEEPSDYEIELIERLSLYPVQFHDVYTYPSDG